MTQEQPEDLTPAEEQSSAGAAPDAAHGPAGGASFGEAAGEVGADTEVEADPSVGAGEPSAEGDLLTVTRMELEERTADLQRLQAEFLNYKRRVDRDRDLIRENATYAVLSPIIEVLDTIDRAREHGDVDGGFKAVAEQLERVVTGLGLTRFGTAGDAFDPTLHEALSHIGTDPDVQVTTCKVIAKAGYRIGERVVRAAQVLVVDPEA